MAELQETIELSALDKEMAEERVSLSYVCIVTIILAEWSNGKRKGKQE